jgi:hypothetical protein
VKATALGKELEKDQLKHEQRQEEVVQSLEQCRIQLGSVQDEISQLKAQLKQ